MTTIDVALGTVPLAAFFQICGQPGDLAAVVQRSLHLTMNHRKRNDVAAPCLQGMGLGGLPWGGSEDASRRAGNYMIMPGNPLGWLRSEKQNCDESTDRSSGVWRQLIRRTLGRSNRRAKVAA